MKNWNHSRICYQRKGLLRMVVHNGAVIGGGTILNDCNVTGVLSRHVLKETIFGRNLKKDITERSTSNLQLSWPIALELNCCQ